MSVRAGLLRIKARPRSEEQSQIKAWGQEMKKMVGTAPVPAVMALSSCFFFFFSYSRWPLLTGHETRCHSGLCSVRSQ